MQKGTGGVLHALPEIQQQEHSVHCKEVVKFQGIDSRRLF
jgi:hypothetical protein